MTAEQLEELLGKVTQGEWDNFEGEDGFWFIEAERGMIGESVAGDALEYDAALIALAPYLARKVIAAEKLVDDMTEMLNGLLMGECLSNYAAAKLLQDIAAYREASK